MPYFPSSYDPRIIVEIKGMSYFPSIYEPSIIVEIKDMSYFPSIYDPTFGQIYYHLRRILRQKMVGRYESNLVGTKVGTKVASGHHDRNLKLIVVIVHHDACDT
jgi:hypothetical protein